jgi:ribosomal protein L18
MSMTNPHARVIIDSESDRYEIDQLADRQPKLATAEDLGHITADAIKSSHEAVAEALSVLAAELADNVRKIELLKKNAEDSMKMCLDIAERAREKGKNDAERIEAAHNRNNEIRKTIEMMREKLEEH